MGKTEDNFISLSYPNLFPKSTPILSTLTYAQQETRHYILYRRKAVRFGIITGRNLFVADFIGHVLLRFSTYPGTLLQQLEYIYESKSTGRITSKKTL